ncbi:carbohydrate kinase [Microbacterium sp. NPDC056044]|uniref:carbohydrate kinase family protein n=1 Tax=Microbacterium sp. NPDC056044 TaxID=3345690 RepID=UPI0035DAE312
MSTRSADTRAPACAVLVVGESLVEIVEAEGEPPREHVGGSPANVALGLGRLGVPVRLHTALARDAHGEMIRRHLAASGVNIDDASWNLPQTSTARARIAPDGAAAYDFDVRWELPTPPRWRGERIIHVGSIAVFLDPGAGQVAHFLTSDGARARVTLDPNIRPALIGEHRDALTTFEEIATRAAIVKLSDEDARWLYPGHDSDAIAQRLTGLGAEAVIFTLGADGAIGYAGQSRLEIPAPRVPVRDTVGAGDTFMAALVRGLASLRPGDSITDEPTLHRLLTRAVAAASITVQRSGADLPTLSEVVAAERREALIRTNRHSIGHAIF